MSFLKDIQGFKRSVLKPTETTTTTASGAKYVERHDADGQLTESAQVVKGGDQFMCVGNGRPDLQIGHVLTNLLVASQDVAADRALLKSHSVSHILNVASIVDNFFPDDFTYLRLGILDLPDTDITEYFPECFEFIDAGLLSGGTVLVHCNAGVSRSTSIVIGYLMNRRRMDFLGALDLVRESRPVTRPNDGFRRQLESYRPYT